MGHALLKKQMMMRTVCWSLQMKFEHKLTFFHTGLTDRSRNILNRSLEHSDRASEHRLNQDLGRQNPTLQAAMAVKKKLNALKKMNKGDVITVDLSLSIFPAKGGNPKKVRF